MRFVLETPTRADSDQRPSNSRGIAGHRCRVQPFNLTMTAHGAVASRATTVPSSIWGLPLAKHNSQWKPKRFTPRQTSWFNPGQHSPLLKHRAQTRITHHISQAASPPPHTPFLRIFEVFVRGGAWEHICHCGARAYFPCTFSPPPPLHPVLSQACAPARAHLDPRTSSHPGPNHPLPAIIPRPCQTDMCAHSFRCSPSAHVSLHEPRRQGS